MRCVKALKFSLRRVLVTGASSGLGRELAVQLARDHGANLVLVARRAELLIALAEEIRRKFRVEVQLIPADLRRVQEAERVFDEAIAQGPLYAAILNAGSTHLGNHDELSFSDFEQMLDLNVRTTVRITMLLLEHFEHNRDQGGLLLVASLSGLTPVAYQSAYSGTKGFLVKYGWALHHEMRPRNVTVSVFAPGGIVSEMTSGPRFNDLRSWLMPVDRAARSALRGFSQRKAVTIPGLVYHWGRSVLLKFVPENFLVQQMAKQYRASLKQNT
jgi:uncharacterized protein